MSRRPVITLVLPGFKTLIPDEVTKLYEMREGDVLEWKWDAETSTLTVVPQRPSLLTDDVREEVRRGFEKGGKI